MHPQYVRIHENRLLGDGKQLVEYGPQALGYFPRGLCQEILHLQYKGKKDFL